MKLFGNRRRNQLTAHPVGELAGKFRSTRLASRNPRSADDRHTVGLDFAPGNYFPQALRTVGFKASTLRASDGIRCAPFPARAASKIQVVISVSWCAAGQGVEGNGAEPYLQQGKTPDGAAKLDVDQRKTSRRALTGAAPAGSEIAVQGFLARKTACVPGVIHQEESRRGNFTALAFRQGNKTRNTKTLWQLKKAK
jgi:hypothetical protein